MTKDLDFIKGIIPPIVTPIDKDEKINEKALREQVDFVIDGGVSGILAFGSNGEFYMLEEDEMESTLKIIVDQVNGRIPVYFGIGAIRTSKCVRIANMAMENGADAISVLQPMFIKPSEDELYNHIAAIADSVKGSPVLLYNNPGRAGYGMSQNLVERLVHEKDNIVGMKDSSGDMTQLEEFIRRNKDRGFKVLAGKDTLIYPGLCCGAVGAVCMTANFAPELVCSIYSKFVSGDIQGSRDAQFTLNPLRLQMDRSSWPTATKDCTNLVGRKVGNVFRPSMPSTPEQMEGLRKQLVKAGVMDN